MEARGILQTLSNQLLQEVVGEILYPITLHVHHAVSGSTYMLKLITEAAARLSESQANHRTYKMMLIKISLTTRQ